MRLELLEVRGETLQPIAAPGIKPPLWPELPLVPRRGSQKLAQDLLRPPQAWLHRSKTRASLSGFGSHLTTPPWQTPESVLERRLGIVRAALWHMDRRGLGRREILGVYENMGHRGESLLLPACVGKALVPGSPG